MNNTNINQKSNDNLKIISNLSNLGQNKLWGEPSKKKFILEVKEANISNTHIGYYFYFKKIISNKRDKNIIINSIESKKNKILESDISSMPNIPKINKSSVKFLEEDD